MAIAGTSTALVPLHLDLEVADDPAPDEEGIYSFSVEDVPYIDVESLSLHERAELRAAILGSLGGAPIVPRRGIRADVERLVAAGMSRENAEALAAAAIIGTGIYA